MDISISPSAIRETNEAERLLALNAYGILDTPAEAAFDDITKLASYICETPTALVSLVETDRQWFKSKIGFDPTETPIDQSICSHALLEQSYLEIYDTALDPRSASNALVSGDPHVRFYAGAVLRTPDGLPLGTLCVLDVKPRRLRPDQREALVALARQVMSQMELRRSLVLADRLQRNVSRLIAIAGHDLKQPLQVMIMTLDRLRTKTTDARDRERVSYAVDAGMRLADELDKLAEMSVIESGETIPNLSAFPINDMLTSVCATWQLHADAKPLRMDVVPSSAHVVSNPTMLRTILGNLVGNAIKYTDRGRVLIGCRRRGHMLSIEVLDTGAGIADDQQETIFEAFRQIKSSSDGLGLGLSIVRRTAQALGHDVTLRSILGRGTHVSVAVPIAGEA